MIAVGSAGLVVGLRWKETSPPAWREMFQVLRLRDGRVVEMQDHDDRRRALEAAGVAA